MSDPTRWDALAREWFDYDHHLMESISRFAAAVEAQTEARVRAEQLKDVRTILRPFIDPPQHGTVSFDEWTTAVDRIAILDRVTTGGTA